MPKCNKCGKHFSATLKLEDGRRKKMGNRKNCLDCSPFGVHKTRGEIRYENDPNAPRTICKICNRPYVYSKKRGDKKTVCNSCNANFRRFEKIKKMLEYKGGCCQICGYNKCSRAMCFHHIDPSTKKFNIGGNHCRKWSTIQEELDKCVLLCHNCHIELETGLISLSSHINEGDNNEN